MATKILLIRHGQTEWNRRKRYSGFIDIDINARGVSQVRRLAKRLKDVAIYKVYSSDRKRALHSAQILFPGRPIQIEADLREMHFGIFEGMTFKQIMKQHPRIYKKWLRDPFSVKIPEGEDTRGFKKRVVEAIKKIISQNRDKTVAVVSHGGAISMFINYILRKNNFWKYIPKPASLSVVEVSNGKAKLRVFNDTSFLT